MGDDNIAHCPIDNNIIYAGPNSDSAIKRFKCGLCRNVLEFCVTCRKITYSYSIINHLLDEHGGSTYVRINIDGLLIFKNAVHIGHLSYLYSYTHNNTIMYDRNNCYDENYIINLAHTKVYYCVFCHAEFDCLPSKEMMEIHISTGCRFT